MRVLAVAALFFAASFVPASAETDGGTLSDYAVTTWTEKEGLPAGRIRSLEQGAEGYLWIGTETGLVRFDGLRFTPWGSGKLPAGTVYSLLSARDRSLWVGMTGSKSIARVQEGNVTLYGASHGLPNALVVALYEDRSGTLWAGTLQGLYRFSGDRWDHIDLGPGTEKLAVVGVHEDREGRLWAATPESVFRRQTPQAPFELAHRFEVASNVWFSFSADPAGKVWVTDFHTGFRKLGERSSRTGKPQGWGVQLIHDKQGTLWVATQGQGLWRVHDVKGAPQTDVVTMRDGLASNVMLALTEDREGNLWLGTTAGLQRLSPHRVTPRRDLGSARVLETTPDGSVWVGTSSGLTRYSPSGARTFTEADGLPGSVILTLHADQDGDLWVATERGIVRYANGRFTPLPLPAGTHMPRVFGITTVKGDAWLRDFFYRLYHWRDGKLLPLDEVPEHFRKDLLTVRTDRRDRVWFGAYAGRLGMRDTNGTFTSFQLPVGNVVRVYEDVHGTIWAGGDNGLSRIIGNEVVSITRADGFPGSVKSVVEDRHGDLWVGIGSGIVRVEKAQFARAAVDRSSPLRFRFFNVADGVAGIPIDEGGTCTGIRAADGRMWFVTSGGVTVVDTNHIGPPPAMPPVRIESVTADAQKFDPQSGLFGSKRTSHLHITFTALTLTDPTRIRFRYRLEGFDHDWVDPGLSREALYTNLPPRQYRFVVEATNGDGVWTPGATWAFGIAPMFYQTQWFYVAVAATLALFVAALWRLRVQRVRRQFALVLGERIRMSRAIHDTLLQGLAGLALQVDDLSHSLEGADPALARGRVLKIRKMVEEYIREARQSIWDLRSPRLAASDLPAALKEAGERAIGDKPVQLDFVVKGTPHRCPPVVEEQLLHIGQEAMNNAVQHGGATRVGIEIAYDDEHTRLKVSDDGCGFDTGATADFDGHYGLISMRERAEQVKGRIVIDSTPGAGTRVEAVVPTS
jgi:signal transduction histidine kinase/ligand-binding sensor domain-containing protein